MTTDIKIPRNETAQSRERDATIEGEDTHFSNDLAYDAKTRVVTTGLRNMAELLGDRRFSLNVGWLGDITQVDYLHEVRARDWTLGPIWWEKP